MKDRFLFTFTFFLLCISGFSHPITIRISDKGGVNDGKTLNTKVLQACIDEVANSKEGGRVEIGPGLWLTGSVELKSNVELFLTENAVLLGSTDPYDYGGESQLGIRKDEDVHDGLIVANGAKNIRICGSGTIDGQGLALALAIDSLHHIGVRVDPNYNAKRMRPGTRPKLFFLEGSENIRIEGLTLKNSAGWGLSLHKSSNVLIDGVKIINRAYWNNDGIDMNDCWQVVVQNCDVNSGDDGICLKSDDPESCCENIMIRNCRIASSASAVKFGTSSYGGFKKITVQDIYVYDTFRSAIALECVDGGILEDVAVKNITAVNTGNPIFICLGARHNPGKGICRNITIQNLKAEVPFGRPDENYDLRGPEVNYFHNPWPSSIAGLPGQYIENVLLQDIEITYPGRASKAMAYMGLYRVKEVNEAAQSSPEFTMYGELPSWAFYVRHVKGIRFKNVKVSLADKDFRPAFVFDDVKEKTLENVNQPDSQIYCVE